MTLADEFFLGTKLYHQKFTELCKPIFKYLGLTYAKYINVNKNGRMFYMCTNYSWVERVLEERYYIIDPLMVHPNNISNGFAVDNSCRDREHREHREYTDAFLYDAAVNFDVWHSFAFVEKNANGGYHSFVFATTKENFYICNRLINEAPVVRRFVRQLSKQVKLLIAKDLQENHMDFAMLKGDVFYSQTGLTFNEAYDEQKKVTALKAAGFVLSSDEQYLLSSANSLSPQEINCLRIYITERSIKQVARELNLAVTTTASYIENVKHKLKCSHKNELLEKAEILEALGRI
jgi:DNA-binding CsgD family transcriptional regulator